MGNGDYDRLKNDFKSIRGFKMDKTDRKLAEMRKLADMVKETRKERETDMYFEKGGDVCDGF